MRDDDELKRERDDARCEQAVQTIKDVLGRLDEFQEGNVSAYDAMGFVVEDLVNAGWCAACVSETVAAAFERANADATQHRPEDDTPFGGSDALH